MVTEAANTSAHQRHVHVPHPHELMAEAEVARNRFDRWHEALLAWLASHVLASKLMFDVALIAPLLVLPAPDSVKITLGVISGSWIQWWGLPAIQRMQVQADLKRDAKIDADHLALTHVATTMDAVHAVNRTQDARLARIEAALGAGRADDEPRSDG